MAAPSLFDFLKNINEPGGNPSMLEDQEAYKAYTPFIINRGMAQSMSTVMFAAELNKRVVVDKEMHYAFLFHSVRKVKRYSKWAKKEEVSEDIKLISEAYQISNEKAAELAQLLSQADIATLKDLMDRGGQIGKKKGA